MDLRLIEQFQGELELRLSVCFLCMKQSPCVPAGEIQDLWPARKPQEEEWRTGREKLPGSGQWATHWNSQTQAPGKAPEPWLGITSKPADSQHLCIQHGLWAQADLG